jgi:hypothetical protein
VDRLVADLDDDDFEKRSAAEEALLKLGPDGVVSMRRHLASKPPLDIVRRLGKILDAIDSSPESLRLLRAVMALEKARTAEAILLLKKLVGGEPGALLTDEAKAALARLGKGMS